MHEDYPLGQEVYSRLNPATLATYASANRLAALSGCLPPSCFAVLNCGSHAGHWPSKAKAAAWESEAKCCSQRCELPSRYAGATWSNRVSHCRQGIGTATACRRLTGPTRMEKLGLGRGGGGGDLSHCQFDGLHLIVGAHKRRCCNDRRDWVCHCAVR